MQTKHDTTVQRLGYSFAETANMLGVSRPYVYSLLEQGELKSFRLGRRHIVTAESLHALVTRKTEAA